MTVKELLALLETETNENLKAVVVNVQQNEIAVYSRSDIDLKEYRGWENLKIAFWGVSENRVIIYSAVEREEAPAPKGKRMTCREWWVNEHSACCRGCPNDYPELKGAAKFCAVNNPNRSNVSAREQCNVCWDQPVPEGVED